MTDMEEAMARAVDIGEKDVSITVSLPELLFDPCHVSFQFIWMFFWNLSCN